MIIYTIGYEKRKIDEYLKILKKNKIHILVDVRERAWSYKRDFCKTKFENSLAEVGIKYIHVKSLGNPKEYRKGTIDKKETLTLYEKYLRKTKNGISDLEIIFSKNDRNICLTCFEREHQECHRSIILKIFTSKKAIEVVNL